MSNNDINYKTYVSLTLPQLGALIVLLVSGTVTVVGFLVQTNARLVVIEEKLERRYLTRTQAVLYVSEVRQQNVGKGIVVPELQAFFKETD